MFFRYQMARSRRFSAATGALLAAFGALAIYRMLQTGRLWGRYRDVEFETDPLVFGFVFVLLVIFTLMTGWSTVLTILPAYASPYVPDWLSDRAQKLEADRKSDLERIRKSYRELDESDEPPVFVIPKQRGVHVSGIHMLDEGTEPSRTISSDGPEQTTLSKSKGQHRETS